MKKSIAAIMVIGALALTGCQTTSALDTTGTSVSAKVKPGGMTQKVMAGKKQFEDGNYGLALKEYRSEVEARPKNSIAWLGLAAAYDKLGRFDLADQAYERLISREGRKPAILNNYGYSYIVRGDLKKAQSLLNEARATAPLSSVIESNWKLAHSK